MIVLELPDMTIEIKILNRVYLVDITEFDVLRRISSLPSMSANFTPENSQIDIYIEQYQGIFEEFLGERLPLPSNPPQKSYFIAKSLLVKLYNLVSQKQEEYLNIEYPVLKDNKDAMQKMLAITENLAKIKAGEDDNKQSNPS